MSPSVRTAVAVALTLALAGCARGSERVDPDSEASYAATELTPEAATDRERGGPEVHPDDSVVATAVTHRVKVFRTPAAEEPFEVMDHPGPLGTPRVFLVQGTRDRWVRVLVPVRPNGTEGWIRRSHIELATTPYRLEVDLGDLQLHVFRRDRQVFQHSVAIGTASTPTPTGLFFTTILARPSSPDSPYGKYAMGLSGYSEVLTTFAGGDGQIAIHGTNQPSLIGTPASHGCIRVDNGTISKLARLLPLGTPVRITP